MKKLILIALIAMLASCKKEQPKETVCPIKGYYYTPISIGIGERIDYDTTYNTHLIMFLNDLEGDGGMFHIPRTYFVCAEFE